MIDLFALKARIDLIELAGAITELRKKTGNEYSGPCPFCGGRDRFNVQKDRWLCRNCTRGKWKDVFSFIASRDNLDLKANFGEIVKRAGWDPGAMSAPSRPKVVMPAYSPPVTDWQQSALEVIERTRAQLASPKGERARRYLLTRGLKPETIDHFRLGFSTGQKIAGLYILEGIVIPCIVRGEIWYLKIRTRSNEQREKYKCATGSRTNAIYNADALIPGQPALFVEGEFDCMLAAQEIGQVIPVVTLGAAKNMPDLATWGGYLASISAALMAYDTDEAGEQGAARIGALLGDRALLAPLPEMERGKDVTDYFTQGGDLWEWIRPYLMHYDPLPAGTISEYALSLAGGE